MSSSTISYWFLISSENKLTAVVGTNTWYYGGVTVKIRRSIPHENFAEFYVNDLALLLLEKPLKFTKLIQPIQLLTTETKRLENVTVSGWGQVWTTGPLSDSLKFNLAVVLSADECKRTMKISFPGQICLGRVIRNGNCFVSYSTLLLFWIIRIPFLGWLWWLCSLQRQVAWNNKLWRCERWPMWIFVSRRWHQSVVLCWLDRKNYER